MNGTASAATTNVAFTTITSAVAAIQSFHVDVSSSSHFATLLPGPKRLKKAIQKQSNRLCSANRDFSTSIEWDLKWTSVSSVSSKCLASETERGLCYTTVTAFTPFSPINNHCLHWTLQHGHKMVFLSSLLDASPSTPVYIVSTLDLFNPFPSVCLSKDLLNTPIFFRADFCPPTHVHPTLYPTAPCPPRCPPFLTHPSCIRCKNQSPLVQKQTQLAPIKPIFWGIHCGQNRIWMHFARRALGQGW